jgi:peptidoglycan/LPS O-acetylase OafA/YrhL
MSALSHPQILGALAALVAIIGVFLPWSTVFFVSRSGIDVGIGIIVALLAVGAAVLVYLGKNGMVLSKKAIGISVIGMIILLVAAYCTYAVSTSEYGRVGNGLYITATGGIALMIAGFWWLQDLRRNNPRIHVTYGAQPSYPPQYPPMPPKQ